MRLLDVHSDPDHHRSVFSLAGGPGALAGAVLAGGEAVLERVDVMGRDSGDRVAAGEHPHVGALDVVPFVYLARRDRGAACAEALVAADRLGEELGLPVLLYGELTSCDGGPGRSRSELRRGGVAGLAARLRAGAGDDEGLAPDFGPARMHPTGGAVLVAAREPLAAFNVLLERPQGVADARRIAGLIREGSEEGLPGVRAIGVAVRGDAGQVSMNVERPLEVPLAEVVRAISRHGTIAGAELVGLIPRGALEGFPEDVPLQGFDPAVHVIENALGF